MCLLVPAGVTFSPVCLRCCKNTRKNRRLDNAVAGTSNFYNPELFVTTTAGEDETSEANPLNRNGDAFDVASRYQAVAELAAAEPATRGSVVQEYTCPLDNPTDRALFQLGSWPSELGSAILHHGPCRQTGRFSISSENGNMRIFSEKHYHMEMEWQWLCFSPPMKKPYCQSCCVFGDRAMEGGVTH